MKLVIATPLYPPEIGGPATYAKLLVERLPKRGIEVSLVKFSGVKKWPKFIRHILYFVRVLRATRSADAVYALDPVSVGFPASLAARWLRKPFFVKIVGDYAWEQGRQRFGVTQNLDDFVANERVPRMVRLLRKIQTRVARAATKVIVPSDYLRNIVVSWGIQKEKIEVIHNAVPQEEPGLVPRTVEKLPRPLIVSVGRLVPWKGMEDLIDAVALLGGQGNRASLAIVGDGPDLVPLVAHAEEKLKGGYIFTGALSHADTLSMMKHADAFVLNSSYEGLSHILIEALMLGVPTIATNIGGNPEVITDEHEGLLVHSGDTAALAAALAKLLSNEELCARLSARARESSKRFSTEAMLSRTSEVLSNL